jgi:hypothetical protein
MISSSRTVPLSAEVVHRVLGEVAELDRGADGHRAAVGLGLAGHHLQQGRLARAVLAHHAPALLAADHQVEAVVDDLLAVGLVRRRRA